MYFLPKVWWRKDFHSLEGIRGSLAPEILIPASHYVRGSCYFEGGAGREGNGCSSALNPKTQFTS